MRGYAQRHSGGGDEEEDWEEDGATDEDYGEGEGEGDDYGEEEYDLDDELGELEFSNTSKDIGYNSRAPSSQLHHQQSVTPPAVSYTTSSQS